MSTQLFSSPEQGGFQFPQSFTEKYRPRKLSDFVGLEKPRKICTRLAENPRESAWYFLGPSGTGKTTLALALAEAIPAELHHIPSQQCTVDEVRRVRDICQRVPWMGHKFHLVLVDEAPRMSTGAQLAFHSILDATNFPPNTILIFTGNSIDGLLDSFLSRTHRVEFSSYGISKEVVSLLEKVWDAETDNPERPNFARIVKDAGNNVRAALMALETAVMSQ